MRSKKHILESERMLIKMGIDTLPCHTEILLDIRSLLIKLLKELKNAK